MVLEVEQKFVLTDTDAFFNYVESQDIEWEVDIEEKDTYFQHPCRDFVQTDEAFRIRERDEKKLSRPDPRLRKRVLTYKGPKLDMEVKTREEVELTLADDALAWERMLKCLGFRKVATVEKARTKAWYYWQGSKIEISLDLLKSMKRYVELEIVVHDESEAASAQEKILSLAEVMGLREVEPRSYLELVLAHSASSEGSE